VVHEIRPVSRGDTSLSIDNRVAICTSCHNKIHDAGISETSVLELERKRKEFLIKIGRFTDGNDRQARVDTGIS